MMRKVTKNPSPSLPGDGGCKIEKGVAEINNQLCSTMFTMVLSEQTAREFKQKSNNLGNNFPVIN